MGSTSLYQLPRAWKGNSLLVGKDGIAMAGIDHAFNEVELPSGRTGDDVRPDAPLAAGALMYVELSFRVRLDAAEARTMASCAEM